jgi:hypothetical protein
VLERRKALSSMTAEDCSACDHRVNTVAGVDSAYMAFLADIPEAWISRRRVGHWKRRADMCVS